MHASISSLMLSKARLSAVLVLRKAGTAVARPGAEKAVVGPVEKEGGAETEFCYAVAKPLGRRSIKPCRRRRRSLGHRALGYRLLIAAG
jgi:hypothetical protein